MNTAKVLSATIGILLAIALVARSFYRNLELQQEQLPWDADDIGKEEDPFLGHGQRERHEVHGSSSKPAHVNRHDLGPYGSPPSSRSFMGVWNRELPKRESRHDTGARYTGKPSGAGPKAQGALSPRGRPATMEDFRYWEPVVKGENLQPLEPRRTPDEKFLSFEPWNGGFNNIRQSLEIAAVIAFASGRTLVMPPKFRMYLRGYSGLEDYFELEDLRKGIRVMMFEEFERLVDWKGKHKGEGTRSLSAGVVSASGLTGPEHTPTHHPELTTRPRECDPGPVKAQVFEAPPGTTWRSALAFCHKKGKEMCCQSSVCGQGAADKSGVTFPLSEGDSWAPVRDRYNDWIQVGRDPGNNRLCQRNIDLYPGAEDEGPEWGTDPDSGYDLKTHILCCDVPKKTRRLLNAMNESAAVGGGAAAMLRRQLLTQTDDYKVAYGGIENAPGVTMFYYSYTPKDTWFREIFCAPRCPRDGSPDKRRFDVWNTENGNRASNPIGGRQKRKHDLEAPEMRDPRVVHFRQNLLGQFYHQVWFQNSAQEVAAKRFVRDHVHFSEQVVAPAEKIIRALGDQQYSCIHVRRGDFQYHDTRVTMEDLIKNTEALYYPGEHIYIATDEKKKDFFQPLHDAGWNISFWDDYAHLAAGTPGHIIPTTEMSVCTRARTFVGTQKSTFSGYIQRVRGYMRDISHKEIFDTQTQYPNGYVPSWAEIWDRPTCGWCREFKESWEGL